MGRDAKKKGRLDPTSDSSKNGATHFIGFSAFATSPTAVNQSLAGSKEQLFAAPVYMGSDDQLQLLFSRIRQKKSTVTKVKALEELSQTVAGDFYDKPTLRQALPHIVWLYINKLYYDNDPDVRAAAITLWKKLYSKVPKAVLARLEDGQDELLPRWYCSQSDPATSVRKAADSLLKSINHDVPLDWMSIESYVRRMLSYGRPSTMYQALYDTSVSSGGLSETEKQESEEVFERVTAVCLDSIRGWLSGEPETVCDDTTSWFKAMSNPHPVLRKKTYQLVSTCCQSGQRLQLPENLTNQLMHALSSEKQPTNAPILLESIVVCLAKTQPEIAKKFAKPLVKTFKRASFGAPAGEWAPLLLPLSAMLLKEDRLELIQAAWQGRELMIGTQAPLFLSVAESCSYGLLTKHLTKKDGFELLSLWREVLAMCMSPNFFETLSSNRRNSITGLDEAIAQLAKDLSKFQTALDCLFVEVSQVFWDSELTFSGCHSLALASLLKQMNTVGDELARPLRIRIGELIENASGERVPSSDDYELLFVVFSKCPKPQNLFENSDIIKFVVNDLVRWMILHTSILSIIEHSDELVDSDFELLRLCLQSVPALQAASVWNTILEELVKARIRLVALERGTRHFLDLGEKIDSQFLLSLAADKSSVILQNYNDAEADRVSAANILRALAGIFHDSALVDSNVVDYWLSLTRSGQAPMQVLDVLNELAGLGSPLLVEEEREVALLELFKIGGSSYTMHVSNLLNSRKTNRISRFLHASYKVIEDRLQFLCSSEKQQQSDVAEWSEQCIRFFRSRSLGEVETPLFQCFSTSSSFNAWQTNTRMAYECCIHLIRRLRSTDLNPQVLWEGVHHDEIPESLLSILGYLCEGRMPFMLIDKLDLNDPAGQLLSVLNVSSTVTKAALVRHVEIMKTKWNASPDRESAGNLVRILAILSSSCFSPLSQKRRRIDPSKLGEGCKLWYSVNANDGLTYQRAVIRKVHYEADTGYFFTIHVETDGAIHERQTIVDRLHFEPERSTSVRYVDEQTMSKEDWIERRELSTLVFDCMCQWLPNETNVSESGILLAEILCILGGTMSLGAEKGVGTLQFRVFQYITKLIRACEQAIETGCLKVMEALCMSLALCLGFGLNTQPHQWTYGRIKFDVSSLLKKITCYIEKEADSLAMRTKIVFTAMITAIMKQLDTSSEDADTVLGVLGALFRLIRDVVTQNNSIQISRQDTLCFEAFLSAIDYLEPLASQNKEDSLSTLQAQCDALPSLVSRFCKMDFLDVGSDFEEQSPMTVLESVLKRGRRNEELLRQVAASCRSNATELCKSLFSETKGLVALRLLCIMVDLHRPLHSADNMELAASSQALINEWTKGLDEDTAIDVEEDVYIVGEWVPALLMSDMEAWEKTDYDDIDSVQTRAWFLAWLFILKTIGAAATVDFRNRPAFISYLDRCGALTHILNLAMLNESSVNSEEDVPPTFATVDELVVADAPSLSDIASVVLFSSIEVLPALSRRWRDEECPKVYRASMQFLVEKYIGPSILQRELQRMRKNRKVFGSMNVTSSTISREVSAEYFQDDFTLRVSISIPAAFPLQKVSVDCSKTLGVPEKLWKRWSLQIMMMLNNQGGTLQDALLLWKDNVDKEFEGVEPCPICYSVLHVKTHKLPSLQCKTCSHRFHGDCLTQWFKNSGKSQCVLCQQSWQGTRV